MRILFVGFAESIHTARWINQLADEKWDIDFFPIHDGPVHADLANITVHSFYKRWPFVNNEKVNRKGLPWPILTGRGKIKALMERAVPERARDSARLAHTIRLLKPDIIHVLEMQGAGYLTLESLKLFKADRIPPCIYSSWGSDFYRYGCEADHETRIRDFLSFCDYYIADCRRDLVLAENFGFRGEVLGVLPVGGGFNLNEMRKYSEPQSSSARNVILIKGYHSERLQGRALVALAALRRCEDLLKQYKVVVYSADREVSQEVQRIGETTLIHISELPNSPHQEMIKLMGCARISISIGLTDGTPNSLLEAMIMGAFPIQSDTVSTGEWIRSGENGLLVPAEETEAIAVAIRKALTQDALVSKAAEINTQIVNQRIDESRIKPQVIEMYKRVAQTPLQRERLLRTQRDLPRLTKSF